MVSGYKLRPLAGQLPYRLAQIRLGHDRVAPIHRLGLVPRELHGHGAGDAGPFEVSNCSPTQVMDHAVLKSGLAARRLPEFAETLWLSALIGANLQIVSELCQGSLEDLWGTQGS